jgi:gamma-glutamyl-gamma-aminobutyrate hydrolase PuuD
VRPLIGLTVGCAQGRDGYDYARLRTTYVHAVQAAGGLPVLVPPQAERDALEAILERLDGLLLPGGGDVDPVEYRARRHRMRRSMRWN